MGLTSLADLPPPLEGLVRHPAGPTPSSQPHQCAAGSLSSILVPHPDGMCHCSPPHNLELRPPKPRPWASMTAPRRMSGVRWESAPQPTQVGLSTFTSTKALGGAGAPDIVMQVDFQYFFYSIIIAYPILTIPLKDPPVPQVTTPPATSILKSGWPLSLGGTSVPGSRGLGAWENRLVLWS